MEPLTFLDLAFTFGFPWELGGEGVLLEPGLCVADLPAFAFDLEVSFLALEAFGVAGLCRGLGLGLGL